MQKLLDEAHSRLSAYKDEQYTLGPHKCLDERFASYIIRLAEEIKEVQLKTSQVLPDGKTIPPST